MYKIRCFCAITVFISIFIISAITISCDGWGRSIDDFIRDNSSIVRGTSHLFTTPHFIRADESVAIPPEETTIINIPVDNPRRFDMIYTLKDSNGNTWSMGDSKNGISLSGTNTMATIRIIGPARLDKFNLQLEMETEMRPMLNYILPELEARYLDCTLESFEVNEINNFYNIEWQETMTPNTHNPAILNYSMQIPYRTDSVNITADVPAGVYSTFKIENSFYAETVRTATQDIILSDTNRVSEYQHNFKIEVTADSTEVRNYNYTVNIVPPPVASDFTAVVASPEDIFSIPQNVTIGASAPWVFTHNGKQMEVQLTPKTGKTQGEITVYYEGIDGTSYAISETPPSAVGKYEVTFEVEADGNFVPREGDEKLTAGTLQIIEQVISFSGGFTDEFFDLTKDSDNDFRYSELLYFEITHDFDRYQIYIDGELRYDSVEGSYGYVYQVSNDYRRYYLDINRWSAPVGEHTLTVIVSVDNGTLGPVYYSKQVRFRVVW